MNSLILVLLIITTGPGDNVHRVHRINKAKEAAEVYYKVGNYKAALTKYIYLIDSMKVAEDKVIANLAHCYYKMKDLKKAEENYNKVASSSDKAIASIANQQLGNIAYQQKETEKALSYFKKAIKAYPDNKEARHNYELLKKLSQKDEKKNQNKDNKRDDQEPPKEPSAYAKKLKEQAEALAGAFKYDEAYKLMEEGAKKDPSVLYFKDFIERLKEISNINKL